MRIRDVASDCRTDLISLQANGMTIFQAEGLHRGVFRQIPNLDRLVQCFQALCNPP